MSTVVFPDLAAVLLAHLRDELNLITGTRVPNPRPAAPFVLARPVGGERITPMHEVTILAFECWAATPADADDLADTVRAAIYEMCPAGALSGRSIDGVAISRVADVAGPAFVPDDLSDQPRATFTLRVQARGSLQEE